MMEKDFEIRKIYKVSELIKAMSTSDENIIYGAGYRAHILMKYLYYKGIHRLALCAAIEDDSVNPVEIYDTPVIALKYLVQFFETANFYIAISEEIQSEIVDVLREKGCRMIYTISDAAFTEMEEGFEMLAASIVADVGIRQNEFITEKTRNEVLWQPEVIKTNTEAFETFRDSNTGKDIVLLATGPTASKYKKMGNVLNIGVNTVPLLDVPIDYYFAHDSRAFKNTTIEDIVKKCDGEIFIGRIAYRIAYIRSEIDISRISRSDIHQYFVNAPCMTDDLVKNICMHSLTDYYSIVFSALQFALFTRPSKIYLVGCDVSGTLEHFNEKSKVVVPHSKYFKLGYSLLKRFAEVYYPSTEIISINPVGLKGLYEDFYQDI